MILEKPTDDFVMPMWMRESGSTAFFLKFFLLLLVGIINQ